MAKFVHSDVLDNGLAAIKSGANKVIVLKAYTVGDSYATVNTTNNIGEAAMTSGDYTLGSSGLNRTLTTASGKTATASANSGASPDLHFAFVDTAGSRVLWVTDETSNQVVTAGNTLTIPALVYQSNQPT